MAQTVASVAEQRLGLAPGAFPFRSRHAVVGKATLHYVDEGTGPVLLMLHGNPAWSYLYRDLILAQRDTCRCIAVDLAGFGLSEPPPGFSFLPRDHAALVAGLIEQLDLRDATLLAHDWGGPIGLAAARATGARIRRLCLGNTWAWPVNGDFHFEWFSRLLGGPLGRFLARRYAVFVNGVMPSSMRRRKLTAEEMAAFRAPFRDPASRRPMHVFPAAITGSRAFLREVEDYVRGFTGPVRFIWPQNDIAFREKELAHWLQLLPQADVVRVPRCGHFLWLDAPEECAAGVRDFMRTAG